MRWTFVLVLVLLAGCGKSDPIPRIEDQRLPRSAELMQALDRGAQQGRIRAALAMGRIQSKDYVGPLVDATKDPDAEIRIAAFFALGQLGLTEGAQVPEVATRVAIEALEEPDPRIVAAAVEALGKLASPGVSRAIMTYLRHPDPRVRVEAAHALLRLRFVPLWRGQTDEPPRWPSGAVAELTEALSDDHLEVRQAVAHALSRYGQPEAVTALLGRLEDSDDVTRLFAVRAIGRSEDEAVIAQLLPALADGHAGVRVEAVRAIASLGGAARLPFTRLSADPSFQVRAALAVAAAELTDPASLAVLELLAADESTTVQAAVVGSLARRLGAGYRNGLLGLLDDVRTEIRSAAASASVALGEAGLPVARRAFADTNTAVQAAALDAMADLQGREEVDPLVFAAALSPDLAVRGTAVDVLSRRDDDVRREKLISVYEASPGDDWIEIRESIVTALKEDVEALRFLQGVATDDSSFVVRNRARIALADAGVPAPELEAPSIEESPLLGVEFDDDPRVVLETTRGEIEIRCLAREAPIHVAGFVQRVRDGFYDGLTWHRVVSNFVIQGGDPRGDGWGTGGQTVRDEINRSRFGRGAVGMPKGGKDTGGCQLFITHVPTPHLDGNYTVFGHVVAGLATVDRIEVGDRIIRARVLPAPAP